MKNWIITVCVLVCVTVAGCGEPTTAAGGGFIAGWTVAMKQANDATENLLAAATEANMTAEQLRELAKENPVAMVAAVDPNLGVEVARLIGNIEAAKEQGGDVDWLTVALAALGLFGGGTAVNLYKNRKATATQ